MCAIRVFPVKSWKLYTLCDCCHMAFRRGTVMYLTATGETFCSHLCHAMQTLNEPETPDLLAESVR